MSYGMSRKNEWLSDCVTNYVRYGVSYKDANKMAQSDALKEEVLHGSVVDLWEPADSLVESKMQQWSLSV